MKAHLKYLRYVLLHKWYVFLECRKLGVPVWIAIFHDWDKFLPDEWFPYVNYFYGEFFYKDTSDIPGGLKSLGIYPKTKVDVEQEFDIAWLYHQKRNKHHWQYWLLQNDQPRPKYLFQSHDDGMTHLVIRTADDCKDVALVYDVSLDWWKPDFEAIKELRNELTATSVALPMPDICRREMLADWRGAGLALNKPDTRGWYIQNKDKMKLHPETRAWIEQQLGVSQ